MEGPRVQHTLHREHGLWFGGSCVLQWRVFTEKGHYPSWGVHRQTAPERLQTASSPGRCGL